MNVLRYSKILYKLSSFLIPFIRWDLIKEYTTMSKPTLYYVKNNFSPPSRTVQLTGAAIGLEFELKEIDLMNGENKSAEYVKINPQHTLPTLVDTDGSVIVDSHAISAYLVQKYGKPEHQSLYPKDLVERAKVDARLHFDSQFLFARIRFFIEPIFYRGFTGNSDDKIEYLQSALETLDSILKNDPYVAGKHMTIADLACYTSVTSIAPIMPMDKYANIVAWIKRIDQFPHLKEINDIGVKTAEAVYQQRMAAKNS